MNENNLIHIFDFQENAYFIFELNKTKIIFLNFHRRYIEYEKAKRQSYSNKIVAFHKYNLLNVNSLFDKSS